MRPVFSIFYAMNELRRERYRIVIRTQLIVLHARRSLMSNAERR